MQRFSSSLLGLLFAAQAQAQGWLPPMGIPMPAWGISQQRPSRPAPWEREQPGWYYVERGAACSDKLTYGRPGAARCTVPAAPAPGAAIEIHGTYDASHTGFGWTGSAEIPIWIVGQSHELRPLLTGRWESRDAAYVIFEDLHFGPHDAADKEFGAHLTEGSHHLAFRRVEWSGNANAAGGLGMGSWRYDGSGAVSHVIVKDSRFHDIGDVKNTSDRDAHCIGVNGSAFDLWVVDNELARCEGDGMQIEARHGQGRGVSRIHHVYFGRNKSHGHKQTAFWVKHASDVVASENDLYGIAQSSSSAGQCTGVQYSPERVWFIFNRIHDCEIGVLVASDDGPGDGQSLYIVGNLIHAIANPGGPADVYNAGCISVRGSRFIHIVNNTCYDSDGGVYARPGPSLRILNNIFSHRHAPEGRELDVGTAGDSTAANNVFFHARGVSINWNGNSFGKVPFAGQCAARCSTRDPDFVNAPEDVDLGRASPAVDAGQVPAVYAEFQERYGLSIAFDLDGGPRPSGQAWDIGAQESGAGAAAALAARPALR
jgi:hypothetical protein